MSDMADVQPTEDFLGISTLCTLVSGSNLGFLSLVHTVYNFGTRNCLGQKFVQDRVHSFLTYQDEVYKMIPTRFQSRPGEHLSAQSVVSPEKYGL